MKEMLDRVRLTATKAEAQNAPVGSARSKPKPGMVAEQFDSTTVAASRSLLPGSSGWTTPYASQSQNQHNAATSPLPMRQFYSVDSVTRDDESTYASSTQEEVDGLRDTLLDFALQTTETVTETRTSQAVFSMIYSKGLSDKTKSAALRTYRGGVMLHNHRLSRVRRPPRNHLVASMD